MSRNWGSQPRSTTMPTPSTVTLWGGQAPPIIQWPGDAFHQATAAVRVPTNTAIDAALAANPAAQLFDPPAPADADSEVVRTRRLTLLPFRYVRLLLPGPLTPREAWVQVAGAIYNENRQAACQPLLDWLRVAFTRQGIGQPSRIARDMLTVPLATPPLIQRRWALVTRDLPLLSDTTAAATSNAIAAGINSLVADNRQSRQADETRRSADSAKTPEKYFGQVGVAKLLRIAQVPNSVAFPQFWLDLSAAPKKQDLVTIQQAFDDMALALNMAGTKIPITPDIASKIRSLGFEMSDEEDLSTGLHPFIFGYMDPAEIAVAYTAQDRYLLIQQGQGAPTLAEAAEFSKSGDTKMPRTLTECTIGFGKWRIALHVLLGPAHTVTRSFETLWHAWNAGQSFLLNVRTRTNPGLFPALAMRWVQLRTSLWFDQQASQNTNVAAPDFVELLTKIRLQEAWEPYIPQRYLAGTQPDPAPPPGAYLPPAQPQPPPPAGPPAPGPRTRGTLERKSSPMNQIFQPFADMSLRIRDVLQRAGTTNRVPPNATGTEMCLSYHIKGMCNTNCARRGDHRDHAPDEDQTLQQWCQQHYTSA